MSEDIVLEARRTWWEIVDSDGGECRLMGIVRELADEVEQLRRNAMKEPIEIVEPTEEERRALFSDRGGGVLKPEQQLVIARLEECIRVVADQPLVAPGVASSDVNPVFRHPYQRAAVRALESAHSEVLNWFDRLNRGFVLSTRDIKPPPETQE